MENIRLEIVWTDNLRRQGWGERAVAQAPLCYASSTLNCYNRYITKFHDYCVERGVTFPNAGEHILADFLCLLADRSDRPRSVLRSTTAALGAFFFSIDVKNPLQSYHLTKLQSALVKSGSIVPMTKSKVMPVQPFYDLFSSWGDNELLSIKCLRLKCISLLALTFMLRPSDIAPKGLLFDPESESYEHFMLCTDQIVFEQDGRLTIKFLGIKNDTSREGFEATIPPSSDDIVDPVKTLSVYMQRTNDVRRCQGNPPRKPVFLGLTRPHSAIRASTVGNILAEAISRAGLQNQGYSAKSFRPTGATRSVAAGIMPELIMQVGRWKTKEVFFNNYVHKVIPSTFSDVILGTAQE